MTTLEHPGERERNRGREGAGKGRRKEEKEREKEGRTEGREEGGRERELFPAGAFSFYIFKFPSPFQKCVCTNTQLHRMV